VVLPPDRTAAFSAERERRARKWTVPAVKTRGHTTNVRRMRAGRRQVMIRGRKRRKTRVRRLPVGRRISVASVVVNAWCLINSPRRTSFSPHRASNHF
jgi:hypothetical protein